MSVVVEITLNGEPRALRADSTVAALVTELGGGTRGVAVALQGEVVPRSAWEQTVIPGGARVEVVVAVQGG